METLWQDARFAARALGKRPGFSAVVIFTLALAAVGIYGLPSYMVSQRTQEIGIRIALGADKRDVLKLVIRQGLKLTTAGIAIGLALASGLARLIASLLYGVAAYDPLTFACVVLLLGAVALLAGLIPATRAARIDPMMALRYE